MVLLAWLRSHTCEMPLQVMWGTPGACRCSGNLWYCEVCAIVLHLGVNWWLSTAWPIKMLGHGRFAVRVPAKNHPLCKYNTILVKCVAPTNHSGLKTLGCLWHTDLGALKPAAPAAEMLSYAWLESVKSSWRKRSPLSSALGVAHCWGCIGVSCVC